MAVTSPELRGRDYTLLAVLGTLGIGAVVLSKRAPAIEAQPIAPQPSPSPSPPPPPPVVAPPAPPVRQPPVAVPPVRPPVSPPPVVTLVDIAVPGYQPPPPPPKPPVEPGYKVVNAAGRVVLATYDLTTAIAKAVATGCGAEVLLNSGGTAYTNHHCPPPPRPRPPRPAGSHAGPVYEPAPPAPPAVPRAPLCPIGQHYLDECGGCVRIGQRCL